MNPSNNEHECKLIPCSSCSMYRVATNNELLWLNDHLPSWELNPGPINMICPSCIEKEKLLHHIRELESTIHYLNERLESLRNIRDNEDIIDKSINQLVHQYASLSINDNDKSLAVDSLAGNVTLLNCTNASRLDASNLTSVQADTTSIFDDILNGLNKNPTSNLLSTHNDSLTPSVPDTLTISTTEHDSLLYISDTSVWDESDQPTKFNDTEIVIPISDQSQNNTKVGSTLSKQPNQTSSKDTSILKLNPVVNSKIEVILAGDRSFKNVKLSLVPTDQKTYLKIAPSDTRTSELIDTVEYFLDKTQNSAACVVLQLTRFDCIYGKTELIKRSITDFSDKLVAQGVALVLSGPVPYPSL